MKKEIKGLIDFIIGIILRAIALAMGIAVIVTTATNADASVIDLIKMLAIAIALLSIVALKNINKGEKDGKEK